MGLHHSEFSGPRELEEYEVCRYWGDDIDQLHGLGRVCEGVGRHHYVPADAQADNA